MGKGTGGFGTGGKGQRNRKKAVFLGRCFKCGEAGHRKQDTLTCFVETVRDMGNVDVEWGWQTPKCPEKVWCPLVLSRATFAGCTGLEN